MNKITIYKGEIKNLAKDREQFLCIDIIDNDYFETCTCFVLRLGTLVTPCRFFTPPTISVYLSSYHSEGSYLVLF